MKLGVLTDIHLAPVGYVGGGWHNPYAFDRAEAMLADAIAGHRADRVDAIAMLGDLANNGDAATLGPALEPLAAAGVPVWVLEGNHDREVEERLIEREAAGAGTSLRMPTPIGEREGGVRVAGSPLVSPGGQPPWFLDALPVEGWGDDVVVLLSHFPLLSRREAILEAGLRYVEGYEDRNRLAEALLERSAPTVVVHGHLHIRDVAAVGPMLQVGCAALIEPPHERVVIEVAAESGDVDVRVRHLAVMESPPVRLPVMSPASSDWTFRDGRWQSI